jgi:hypothetical protein
MSKTKQTTSIPPPALVGPVPASLPCTVCGSTPCMALIRADVSPVGVIDLIDRTLARLTSSHWTARQSAHLGFIIAMIALAITLFTLALTDRLGPAISHTTHLPWGWAYLTGSSLLGVGGYAVHRIPRHRRSFDSSEPKW